MFHCSVIKDRFALPFVSNSFSIISCCFLPVKKFFQLFRGCFYFSLAATLVVYHIYRTVVKNFFCNFSAFTERRRRDLNPRAATNDLLPFQGSPFSHLGISPKCLSMTVYKIVVLTHSLVWNGESGIRTHAPFRTNGFQDRLVMTASISLQTCLSIIL